MNRDLLPLLRCPQTQTRLTLVDAKEEDDHIVSGWLVSEERQCRYPVVGGIPRFVPESNYADNFGMQWNLFSRTQLDSYSGHSITADRFWSATGWQEHDLRGQVVLDAGCGSGRFAEIALATGATVIALDYSSAVDACLKNLGHHPNLHVVQGDIFTLPFAHSTFSHVYSLGVLQHTPDPQRALAALPPMLRTDGWLCVDFYWKRLQTMLHMKYLLRPVTTRIPQAQLFAWLQSSVPALLRASQLVRAVPMIGRGLQRFVPVADYTGRYPLNARQLEEWALLDTFDWLAPSYDKPQTVATIRRWMQEAGLSEVEVFHAGHLVARGRR